MFALAAASHLHFLLSAVHAVSPDETHRFTGVGASASLGTMYR